MRNPFAAIGRLLSLRARGQAVLDLAQEAKADPRRYRDLTWWTRLVIAAHRLLEVLPLATEVRVNLQTVMLKGGVVLGAIGGLAGYLSDQGILAMLPPKYAATIGIVCGSAATIAAYLHPAPGKPQAQP